MSDYFGVKSFLVLFFKKERFLLLFNGTTSRADAAT